MSVARLMEESVKRELTVHIENVAGTKSRHVYTQKNETEKFASEVLQGHIPHLRLAHQRNEFRFRKNTRQQ